ncbi:MAG: helix-turn-helix domain-containing protein [Prevotellaceae bacterium]|jgi:DNA-binding XRE family transcriptional regulator|nr:helix-turn-helix domain-containing protein [Prevotellaceae bacterium]
MKKSKLIEVRESKGLSQEQMAFALNLDTSCYCRRESGETKISHAQWQTLANTLNVPFDDIYEEDEKQVFICKDNVSVNYQGTNNIYSIPEFLLENQQKYIEVLLEKIESLEKQLQNN